MLTLAALLALATPALCQDIEITTIHDDKYRGLWQGVQDGDYVLNIRGQIKRIPESQVKTVRVLSLEGAKGTEQAQPRSLAGRAYAELVRIEEATRLRDFDTAFKLLDKLVEQIRELEFEARSLYDRVQSQYLLSLIEKRDVKAIVLHLGTLESLPEPNQRYLVDLLAMKLKELVRSEPKGEFTAKLAAAVASYLSTDTPMSDIHRKQLIALLMQVGEAENKEGHFGDAAEIFAGVARLDADRREELRPVVAKARMAHVRQMHRTGRFADAISMLQKHLLTAPDDAEATALLAELEFGRLQKEVGESLPTRARALLEAYLSKSRSEAHRKWAVARLEDLRKLGPAEVRIAKEIETYYPVVPGRWMRYERVDTRFEETIHTDSARAEEGAVVVYHTLDEKYKDWTTRKVYQVEIDKTRVSRLIGEKREVLLEFPASAGKSWTWKVKNQTFTRTVIATDATVTVPAGTFRNCLTLRFESVLDADGRITRISSTSYYAPGVGLVKLEFDQPDYQGYGMRLKAFGRDENR